MTVFAKIDSVAEMVCGGLFCGWPICFWILVWLGRRREPEPDRDDYTDEDPGHPKEGT